MTHSAPVVSVQSLSYDYPRKSASQKNVQALNDLSFCVGRGKIFGFLGPNGGGKTTLFRILSTGLGSFVGDVSLLGFSLPQESEKIRERIGIIFQHPSLDQKLTVAENLLHQGHFYGLFGQTLQGEIGRVSEALGLTQRLGDRVETLSGGLARRAEIAKGLLHRPKLLLMDEPSTGLDPGARLDLWVYLQAVRKQGVTILVTTHLMEEAEKCDELLILNHGQMVAMGSPQNLKGETGLDIVHIQTPDPGALAEDIKTKFGLAAYVVEGEIVLEKEKGHEFVPQLVQSFPQKVTAVTVGKPTLEDVFVRKTGHHFWSSNGVSA